MPGIGFEAREAAVLDHGDGPTPGNAQRAIAVDALHAGEIRHRVFLLVVCGQWQDLEAVRRHASDACPATPDSRYNAMGGRRRTGPSPTRSGPEGSSRNEFRSGSSVRSPFTRPRFLLMSDSAAAYRVLARKYRPSTFAELIGQEAMVRTLSNAIATGRIAHAFILTGVRGVGKTTTARILARALNCVGPDGAGGVTVVPCGVCAQCFAIAEDRHVDVMEMDAASRTGVDDIRDLTEGVRYRPVSGRYKVYIIDEVHMLSKNAFNALLKTLEEPPPDVK